MRKQRSRKRNRLPQMEGPGFKVRVSASLPPELFLNHLHHQGCTHFGHRTLWGTTVACSLTSSGPASLLVPWTAEKTGSVSTNLPINYRHRKTKTILWMVSWFVQPITSLNGGPVNFPNIGGSSWRRLSTETWAPSVTWGSDLSGKELFPIARELSVFWGHESMPSSLNSFSQRSKTSVRFF